MNIAIDINQTTGADRSHILRRRAILEAHPEVRNLFTHDVVTFWITAGIFLLQLGIAAWMGSLGMSHWWLSAIFAYCVGAFANHAMFVIIHDSIHNAVFESPTLNKWNALLADLPNAFPTAMGFRCYHIKHHSHLSSYDYDADVPSEWEARMVGNSSWRKSLWLFFFAIMQLTRIYRLKGTVPIYGKWTYINIAVIAVFDAAVWYFLGGNALLYFFLSFWFSVGLHPVGARWIQEHYAAWPGQGTFDYYGPLNVIALNIGYHNEHHDFPEVPWRLLPRLKTMAPEFYDNLRYHPSWVKLFFDFLFNPRYSLHSRTANTAQ
ncbi:MAG: fatty acid desaturase [Hyphomicrobiales bacterium]|nr:fatty acid desaturase [Hyphomicrobiales bacterium]